jgi:hypothetical protein
VKAKIARHAEPVITRNAAAILDAAKCSMAAISADRDPIRSSRMAVYWR